MKKKKVSKKKKDNSVPLDRGDINKDSNKNRGKNEVKIKNQSSLGWPWD